MRRRIPQLLWIAGGRRQASNPVSRPDAIYKNVKSYE
jgi:hypothetical protein